ncbi:protein of unknown function [endosymbiont DhMRE of Dentiscutata heterogama]|uniref:hypothetical protein n=1 Tax=endosymbiont DhMRE of Dentiscutata heterogama TaxID=1609546 RepID=UPI000629D6A8|nr:hypothetical protein [endosymbiont DhMRE of Dentiscutata heterogama]CFW92945.1 protein of unknown function [endosymbiont DhMRE of Dentiscutata heterogama]
MRDNIRQYFNLLVKKFVKLGNHSLKIVFEDDLSRIIVKESEKLLLKRGGTITGNVNYNSQQKRKSFLWFYKWWSLPRVKYTVSFLNSYPNNDELRQVAVHEFTHLYLFWKKITKKWNEKKWKLLKKKDIDHEHDDNFYAQMDYFEAWIDQELNLPARKNKGDDWIQHINPLRHRQRQDEYITKSAFELARTRIKKYVRN